MPDKKFPIAMLCLSRSWGGLEMHVASLAGWLTERGWPVTLFAESGSSLYHEAHSRDIQVLQLNSGSIPKKIKTAREISRRVKSNDIRFMSVHRTPDIFPAVLAKRFSGNKFKLAYSQHMHIGNKKDFFHAWEYRHFDAWLTPLNLLADQTRENTIVPAEKIHIIPQGIELERFPNNRYSKTEARKILDLPQNDIIIGLIGRFDPQKGQMTLVRALPKIHNAGYQVHLLFVGEPTAGEHEGFKSEIEKAILNYGIEKYVHFRPFLRDVEQVYAALDIFILASYSETYGLVTIEAMASGLPVIGTRSGGTKEIISDGITGLLFEPKNHDELSLKILRLLQNREEAQSLAVAARQSARRDYSHISQCENWEKIIRSLTAKMPLGT